AATALHRVGEIGRKIGHSWASEDGYRRAVKLLEELIEIRPAEEAYRVLAINCYESLGFTLTDFGDHVSGEEAFRTGIKHAETLTTAFPKAEHFRLLSRLYANLCLPLERQGRLVEAETIFHRAREVVRKVIALEGD